MYSERYHPLPLTQDFPQVLSELTDSETFHLNFMIYSPAAKSKKMSKKGTCSTVWSEKI